MNTKKLEQRRMELRVSCPNEGSHRTGTVRQLLAGTIDVKNKNLVDLGAGPCIFAKIARDAGAFVTAVDGRTDRLPSEVELGSIQFVQSDVRKFDTAPYDVKFVFGLLYHLEFDDQMELLRNCAQSGITVLDTQVNWPDIITAFPQQPWQISTVSVKGYDGIFFPEGDNPMASIGNPASFWPNESSLVRMIEQAGFSSVTIVDPAYLSKYGPRRFMICRS